jgi:hypothetical protein
MTEGAVFELRSFTKIVKGTRETERVLAKVPRTVIDGRGTKAMSRKQEKECENNVNRNM